MMMIPYGGIPPAPSDRGGNNYSSVSPSGPPPWMNNVPIPEVQQALAEQERKRLAEKGANDLQAYLDSRKGDESANASESSPASKQDVLSEGTVFLVWKANEDEPVQKEMDKFPVQTGFHFADFEDYATKDELHQIILRFQAILDEYNAIEHRRGTYAIVVGRMVKNVQKQVKKVEIETVDIQF